jgi:hypothetical protein
MHIAKTDYESNDSEEDIENEQEATNERREEEAITDTEILLTNDGNWTITKQNPDYIISINKITNVRSRDITYYNIDTKIPSLSINNIPEKVAITIAEYLVEEGANTAECYTSIRYIPRQPKANVVSFRAHPNFQKKPWYDWAMVQFEESNDDQEREIYNEEHNVDPAYPYGMYPCKLLSFFRIENKLLAVIHSTEYKNNSKDDSVLTERWKLEYKKENVNLWESVLRIIDIETIMDSVYVMQETPGFLPLLDKSRNETNLVVLVKKKNTWGTYFT